MVNKAVFQTKRGARAKSTETRNAAGGFAYKMSSKAALAQFGLTGTFNDQYYTSGEQQLDRMLELCAEVEPEYIAKCAIYCRNEGFMKDMPAFMLAYLANQDVALLKKVFPRVMNNALMVKKFATILRSGVTGRKSFGSAVRNILRRWLNSRHDDQLFRDSVGGDVTLADLIKMVHPRPANKEREALHGYLLGKEYDKALLPGLARKYELYKSGDSKEVPNVPFQFLTSLDLGTKEWTDIAKNAKWQMTRMNLNTFMRHGVFKDSAMVKMVADRLANKELIEKAMIFPYQLLAAYMNINDEMPRKIVDALHDAMEIATKNVPSLEGRVAVACDVSGSMTFSSITGYRKGASSAVRPIDVAGLVTAVMLRNNRDAIILPFSHDVIDVRLEPRDSVMTNARALGRIGGGSTNCSAPLQRLNGRREKVDLVVFVSDNMSWIDSDSNQSAYYGTGMAQAWKALKSRNPKAKLVCIDTCADDTVQMYDEIDAMNIGGFSDQVFKLMHLFLRNELGGEHLVNVIEAVELDAD